MLSNLSLMQILDILLK